MNQDINQVTLQGTLPRDANYRLLGADQTPNVSFTVMTSKKWVDAKTTEPKVSSQYNSVVAWRNIAENNQEALKMGARVKIVGELTSRSWDDPQTGEKKYKTEVVASQIFILDGNSSNDESGESKQSSSADMDAPITADDLPF